MDITSTAAMTNPVAQTPTKPAATTAPKADETNLQAIRDEIRTITADVESKLKPLAKDTVQFSKPAAATPTAPEVAEIKPEEVPVTTALEATPAATPTSAEITPAPSAKKEATA